MWHSIGSATKPGHNLSTKKHVLKFKKNVVKVGFMFLQLIAPRYIRHTYMCIGWSLIGAFAVLRGFS